MYVLMSETFFFYHYSVYLRIMLQLHFYAVDGQISTSTLIDKKHSVFCVLTAAT